MELSILPELEGKLAQLAQRTGRGTEEMLNEALERYLDEEQQFLAAVEKGIESARRGEFIDHADVIARVTRRVQAKQR